jgi:hypothetical protein
MLGPSRLATAAPTKIGACRFNLALSALCLACLPGCTTVTAKRVTSDDYTTEGVRYWLAEPYLLVKARFALSRTETVVSAQSLPEKAPEAVTSDGVCSPDCPPPQANPADGIAIVWLPDYCQQYALLQDVKLASLKWKVELADGWRLSSVDMTADSTQVATKILDVLSTAVAAGKDIAVAGISRKARTFEGQGGPDRNCRRRTEVKYLNPGVYKLFVRTDDKCKDTPKFSPAPLTIETVVCLSEKVPCQ